MLTSKIITESVEHHAECCGCVNSCNKFVSTRSWQPWNSLWYCDEKLALPPLPPSWKNRGSNAPALRASLRVTEKYTSITNILNAIAHLQLEVCNSSQDLFKHLTNKNHHNYLQNHIKSISTWSLSNHQRSNNVLNIGSVVVTTYYSIKVYRCSKSMRGYMHCECWIPVHCDATIEWDEVGKFASLATWKHCDETVSKIICWSWLLKTQAKL